MASSAAAAVAAATARVRREVREYFENAQAFDPAHAVPYQPPRRIYERQMAVLVRRGILKETRAGCYWLDREALELEAARQAQIAKMTLLILGACVVIAIVLGLVFGFSGT